MQLSSVSLPVGGFSFSQGFEYAIDAGWVTRSNQVAHWVETQMTESLARLDLPVLKLAMEALNSPSSSLMTLRECNDLVLACRETKELKLTDTAMGEALGRLLRSLDMPVPFAKGETVSFVTLFAVAAHYWTIPFHTAALGFAWSWLENQIAAATKLVPLGQTQAQQLLGELQIGIPAAIAVADALPSDDIGAGLPAIAIASARHETQYSRLFRS
ncbi:urease accessory protein UreF [Marinomonas sp. 2405UD68-3]|uniref:urease accessory protein UreF n=1 Tax=Marinomonas sp. 2405UD68-3 TaxID=3391835 RepID=UPI0039C8D12E